MTRTWNDLEGATLGRYWLKVCLTSSADDAWYSIRYDTTRDAAVRVRHAAAPDAGAQLDLWRKATELEHPSLVRMLDAGRAEAEGDEYIYCVCEYPDDFVAGVLAERPLSAAEAREVLDATLSALTYLHERGLVHGAVGSGHIMAFGDTIKLPSDTVREAGEGEPVSSDLRAVGVLLHELLTREVPRADAKTDFGYLPEPFRSIVRNTLKPEGERWTITDIRAHLNPPKPVVVTEANTAPKPEVVAEPVAAAAVDAPRVETPRPTLPPPRPRTEPPVDRGFPLKWIPVAGLAAAAVLGAFVLRNPGGEPTPAPATTPAPVSRPAPVNKPVNPPAVTPQPAKPSPLPPPNTRADRAGTPDARPSTSAAIWRVIAYTYNGRTNAEKKAKALNEKRAGWRAEVFAPKGDRAPYFVSLGGRMTLTEAEKVQREARAKGLPRDTFVRNFSN
jgi:hypothetical protein